MHRTPSRGVRALAFVSVLILLQFVGLSRSAFSAVIVAANGVTKELSQTQTTVVVSQAGTKTADLPLASNYPTPNSAIASVEDISVGQVYDQTNLPGLDPPMKIRLGAYVGSGGVASASKASVTVKQTIKIRSENGFVPNQIPGMPTHFATFRFGIDGQFEIGLRENKLATIFGEPQFYENRKPQSYGLIYFDNLTPFYGGIGSINGAAGDTVGDLNQVFVGDQGHLGLNLIPPRLSSREPRLNTRGLTFPVRPTDYLESAYLEGSETSNDWAYHFGPDGPRNAPPFVEIIAPMTIDPEDPKEATALLHFEVAVVAAGAPWEEIDFDFANTVSLLDYGIGSSAGAISTPESFFRNYSFDFIDNRPVPEPSSLVLLCLVSAVFSKMRPHR
ncbi:PEP-CTERM sorting domain-containing protein [Botrimarina sp.]|uniref:PEP-CTERM sorting domain-containing protein n=1 Tax=Botrimarina sp. TaxID=2795802 RepID=UPI0032EF84A6